MKNGWRIGLDLGSTAAKAVLLSPDGEIAGQCIRPSGTLQGQTAALMIEELSALADNEKPRLAATGYGRALVVGADKTVTEITCHARGLKRLHPQARTLLDIGGQDAKAIRLGQDGTVEDFAMNDRCAAGTGRFLEVLAARFHVGIDALSALCGDNPGYSSDNEEEEILDISSTCVVFAESEVVGLLARGTQPIVLAQAVHRAIARRVKLLLSQIKPLEPLFFTGGGARNETLRLAVMHEIGMPLYRADNCQFAGAIGAALSLG